MRIRSVSLSAAVAATTALFALAAPLRAQTTFFGLDDPRGALTNSNSARDNFLAQLLTFGTDDIEARSGTNPTLVFGTTGVTGATSNLSVFQGAGSFAPVSGTNSLLNPNSSVNSAITFSSPIVGFGLYVVSAGTTGGNTLSLRLENTITITDRVVPIVSYTAANIDNVFYFGVIDAGSPFNRITIQSTNPSDGFFPDDLTAATAVVPTSGVIPEPGTLALLLVGSLTTGAGLLRRRKRTGAA